MAEEATNTPASTDTANPEATEQVNDGVPSGDGSPQTGDVSAAAKEAIRRLKFKNDDGTEEEVDEDVVLKTYRERKLHQREANKRFQEGQALRKQSEQLLTLLKDKTKIKEVLKQVGYDPRTLSEEILMAELAEEQMDPRDKELRDTKNKLKELEDMDKKKQEAAQEAIRKELEAKYKKKYEAEFVEALQKTDLPPTKETVAKMAHYISRAAKLNFEMTAAEAAQMVREDLLAAHQRLFGNLDGEMLIKMLGPDLANKVRKYDTSKLKNPESMLHTPGSGDQTRAERGGPSKRMSAREWQKFKRGL